ncbi:MAG TPA: protein translocase subunit SecF [Thermoclostridium caenicola]|nr:protein translocase subunit SecF [Thermoclostridium caenicola]
MTGFDFVKNRKIFFSISGVLLLTFLVLYLINGAVLDITFRGGTRISLECREMVDANLAAVKLEEALNKKINTSVMETVSGSQETAKKTIMLRIDVASQTPLTPEEEELVEDTLVKAGFPIIPNSPNNQVASIEPSIGKETLGKGLLAVLISSLLILVYVSWRFSIMSGLSAAVCAVIALLHDCAVMLGVYVAFRIPFNDVFIAAILTIIGYSINDTIIIYDRIRENAKIMQKSDLETIVNVSIWQTLSRTINTTLTTLISVVVLYIFAAANNIGSLKDFSLSLIVGCIAGTYSSVFIAANLWHWLRTIRLKAKTASAK